MGCINLTLVPAYIATEVLDALHPGATGLCFITEVWLVTLIGLTNSLSTSRFLDDKKKLDVTNQIHVLHRSHLLPWSTTSRRAQRISAPYYLTTVFDNCVPRRQHSIQKNPSTTVYSEH